MNLQCRGAGVEPGYVAYHMPGTGSGGIALPPVYTASTPLSSRAVHAAMAASSKLAGTRTPWASPTSYAEDADFCMHKLAKPTSFLHSR
jgi:hypothetical protein